MVRIDFNALTEYLTGGLGLRAHPHQEWYDLYKTSTNDELQLFFNHYTKGIDNGWEETPKARVSILRFNEVSTVPFSFSTTKPTNIVLGPSDQQEFYRLADSEHRIPNPLPRSRSETHPKINH